MHFCTAHIAIAEDERNVYVAGTFDPVSWPEVMVLLAVHGETAVTKVEPFVEVEQHPRDERQRLSEKYGESIVASVFGGRQAPNEMNAAGVTLKSGIMWQNPITREVGVTGGAIIPQGDQTSLEPIGIMEAAQGLPDGTPQRVGGRFAKAR